MVQEGQLNLMVDRIIGLKKIPEKLIIKGGFEWYLDQEYLVPEAFILEPSEIDHYIDVAEKGAKLFRDITRRIITNAEWDHFPFPMAMRSMIIDSWEKQDLHLLGRLDVSGGIDGLPTKIYEFNADTPTMLPETVVFQNLMKNEVRGTRYVQFNKIRLELQAAFRSLLDSHPYKENTLLVTSLGYEEDVLNAQVIVEIAKEAGFNAEYADLEQVVFDNDGVYLDFDDGSDQRFDYMYKIVPWEFIMYEEPELLEILKDLYDRDKIYIMNPAYTAIMQSKSILPYVYNNDEFGITLKSSYNPGEFYGESYVEKVEFGRLGENVKIVDKMGSEISRNLGDYGGYEKIYQEFAPLYQDEDDEYYQPGIYVVGGEPAGISFRRSEHLIVDDDSEFIPHLIAQ